MESNEEPIIVINKEADESREEQERTTQIINQNQIVIESEDSDDSVVIYDNEEERENAELNEKEVNHLARPLFLGTFFVKYPYIAFFGIISVLLICTGLTLGFKLMELDGQSDRDMLVWDDDRVYTYDLQVLAGEAL